MPLNAPTQHKPLVTISSGSSPAAAEPVVEDFASDDWLPLMRTRVLESTFDSYRRNVDLHINPSLGRRPVASITPVDLNRLYSQLLKGGNRHTGKGLSPRTVLYIHHVAYGLFSHATDLGLLPFNPATRSRPPRLSNRGRIHPTVWTAAQLREFLDAIRDDPLYPALRLAALTGMRRGEVLGLRWGDVDLAARRLVVCHTLVTVGYEVRESIPKGARSRVLKLDSNTALVLADQVPAAQSRPAPSDWVFTDDGGRPFHPDLVTQRFDRLVARTDLPRIRLHDLRHTYASISLASAVPVWVVTDRLGHSRPEYTLSIYAHALPGMDQQAAEQVAGLVDNGRSQR